MVRIKYNSTFDSSKYVGKTFKRFVRGSRQPITGRAASYDSVKRSFLTTYDDRSDEEIKETEMEDIFNEQIFIRQVALHEIGVIKDNPFIESYKENKYKIDDNINQNNFIGIQIYHNNKNGIVESYFESTRKYKINYNNGKNDFLSHNQVINGLINANKINKENNKNKNIQIEILHDNNNNNNSDNDNDNDNNNKYNNDNDNDNIEDEAMEFNNLNEMTDSLHNKSIEGIEKTCHLSPVKKLKTYVSNNKIKYNTKKRIKVNNITIKNNNNDITLDHTEDLVRKKLIRDQQIVQNIARGRRERACIWLNNYSYTNSYSNKEEGYNALLEILIEALEQKEIVPFVTINQWNLLKPPVAKSAEEILQDFVYEHGLEVLKLILVLWVPRRIKATSILLILKLLLVLPGITVQFIQESQIEPVLVQLEENSKKGEYHPSIGYIANHILNHWEKVLIQTNHSKPDKKNSVRMTGELNSNDLYNNLNIKRKLKPDYLIRQEKEMLFKKKKKTILLDDDDEFIPDYLDDEES